MIGKYIKKPVEVEAMQYTKENKVPFLKFVGENMMMKVCYTDTGEMEGFKPFIKTLEGDMLISYGDYVIKGVHGEFYPCKEDIFLETYEKIEE